MADRLLTLKKWEQMKRDIFDDFFTQNDVKRDIQELMKAELLGEGVPDKELQGDINGL